MYFHKAQEKPQRYGNVNDIQYSIKRNMESIYRCNPDDEVLIMPLFWGLPCLDFSGNNNHGTNHGATYKDGGLDFDGANDEIRLGNTITFNNGDNWTLNFRTICFAVTHTYAKGMILGDRDSSNDFVWYQPDFQLRYRNSAGQSYNFTSETVFTDLITYQLVSDGSSVKLYKNGSYVNSASAITSLIINTIGQAYNDSLTHYLGYIYEVRIAKVTRTAEQIALFYERPWDLYRRVSRSVYFLPGAVGGVTMPIFIHHQNQMRA